MELQDGSLAQVQGSRAISVVLSGDAWDGAEVLYAGAVPGYVAGFLQINLRVPHFRAPIMTASAVHPRSTTEDAYRPKCKNLLPDRHFAVI